MKVYANENLEMSFISVNFSTLFYKRNRKLSPTLKGTQESAKRIIYRRIFYAPLMCLFFCLQAALVTNALIPVIIILSNIVSYYCRMSSSDSEKGEIEISPILVGAPKQRLKDDNTDWIPIQFLTIILYYIIYIYKFKFFIQNCGKSTTFEVQKLNIYSTVANLSFHLM